MDHSSYYSSKYGNYMLGSLNYPLASYENPCADYLPTQQNDPHQILQQPTSHGYDSSTAIVGNGSGHGGHGIGNGNSVICNGASSVAIDGLTNSSTAASAAAIVNKVSKLNDASKHYSVGVYGGMDGVGTAVNYNATNMNTYGNGYSSCSKMYENNGSASATTGNGLSGSDGANNNASGYAANINYGPPYQDLDYSSAHVKNTNQYYAIPTATMANPTSNTSRITHTMNVTPAAAAAATASVANESIIHLHQSSRHLPAQYDGRLSAKTSVIKSLNSYTSSPINYSSKYVVPYPAAVAHSNNAKSVMNVAATAAPNDETGSMHSCSTSSSSLIRSPVFSGGSGGSGSSATASNYKSPEVICPEPITRYASNHTFAVSTNNNASNGHYLPASNYGYANHHSSRSAMHPTAYQTQVNNDSTAGIGTYYNNPNSLIVRPTPSNYPKCQLPYPNSYNYTTVPTTRAGIVQKHSSQKTTAIADNDPIGAASTLVDDTYDRHYHRSYNAMYNTNYMDMYDDYPYQYSAASAVGPSGINTNTPYYHHQQQKSMSSAAAAAAAKAMYGTYGNGLNMYSGAQQTQPNHSATTTSSSPSMQSMPVITTTSGSQMISSNFDMNARAHCQASSTVHPIVPNPVYGTNKDYYATATSTAAAPGSYPCSYMYPPFANSNYNPTAAATKATVVTSAAEALPVSNSSNSIGYNVPHHYSYEKSSMHPMHPEKYSLIDLEEQINSSKILKVSRASQQFHHPKQQLPPPSSMNRQTNAGKVMPNAEYSGAYRKTIPSHRGQSQQYVYNYNVYNNCYQQKWQPTTSLPQRDNAAAVAAAAADNLKKQSLRDFLSSWNDDEEEGESDPGANGRKSGKTMTHSTRMAETSENVLMQSQPIIQLPHKVMPVQQTAPQQPFIQTQHVPPTVIHHDNSNGTAMKTPKIHVGITVDNGCNSAHNLPDIIIDIEKPKVSSESECFQRANVIQGMPSQPPPPPTNQSEKLYILDSIDVPLADLNKYRHLSVVNKLPDNIVLTADHGENNVTESLKFIEEVETNHARFFKNDFEMNVEYDDDGKCLLDVSDLVECKNMTTVRNVKRIIRKYRKQREYLRKTKMSSAHRIRAKIAPPPPPTPVPASFLDEMPATPRPVDLSANRPVTPVTKPMDDGIVNDLCSPESFSSLESLSFSNDDIDSANNPDDATDAQRLDTLKTMCIKTVNTTEFRDFFTENFINRRPNVGAAFVTIPMPTRYVVNQTTTVRPKQNEIEDEIIDLTDDSTVIDMPVSVTMKPASQPELCVPKLRHLAMQMVRNNQYHLMMNVRALKLPENAIESEQRPSTVDTNPNAFKVKTLQELAREVANTIYSFNVKPLQDICKLAIEKFDNLFVEMQKMEGM